MLPVDDKTPIGYKPNHVMTPKTKIKMLLRKMIYPTYLRLLHPVCNRIFGRDGTLDVDQWYWGHRGLEFELLHERVHRLYGVHGKSVLIAGCGTGRDIASWVNYSPASIIGVDYFNYQTAWNQVTQNLGTKVPIAFVQGDLTNLAGSIADNSFDIIGSDAVFEHLKHLPDILREFHRILKPGGIVYATFGPLWYSWGGDHISGYDAIDSGYNHLLLEPEEYEVYLESAGEFAHSEHDGRTWIRHGLFSYLRPAAYQDELKKAGFEKIYSGAVIDPRAVRCLREYPEIRQRLLKNKERKLTELDLIVTGMTLLYRKIW